MDSPKRHLSLQKTVHQRQRLIFCTLFILLFFLMLLLNMLSPWVADDYYYAYSFATDEKLDSIWDIFPSLKTHGTFMNGRYTPHFFVQLFTMLPLWVFDIFNSAMFVWMILGMHRMVCGPGKYDVAMLCGLTGAVFMLVPGFGPSFLWMAGSCNYLWCDVLLFWLLVPFADAVLGRRTAPKLIIQFLMIPAALFFGNMSQNVSAAGIMLMVLAMLWLKRKRQPVHWWMVLTAIAAFAGWFLCMRTPADIHRIRYGTPNLGQILDNFQLAADMMLKYGTLPCIALLILTTFSWYGGMKKEYAVIIIGMFLAAMASNYAMSVSVYYPDRAFTGTTLLLICSCALAVSEMRRPAIKMSLSLCLVFSMAVTMLYELPDIYKCYAMYKDREVQVAQAVSAGETSLTTFGIESRSRYDGFYQLHDLTIYPDTMANMYYARYHGLDSIVVDRFE